jgi:hypothetical protein
MARVSSFTGKPLYSTVTENPRRKDSIGYKSHRIILKNPGISFEDFVRKGGDPASLRWDLEHGYITTNKPRAKVAKKAAPAANENHPTGTPRKTA